MPYCMYLLGRELSNKAVSSRQVRIHSTNSKHQKSGSKIHLAIGRQILRSIDYRTTSNRNRSKALILTARRAHADLSVQVPI